MAHLCLNPKLLLPFATFLLHHQLIDDEGVHGPAEIDWSPLAVFQTPLSKQVFAKQDTTKSTLKDEFQRLEKFLELHCLFACTFFCIYFEAFQSNSAAAFLAAFLFQPAPCVSGSISTTHTSKHWNAKTTLALCADLGLTFKQNTL